MGSIGTMPLEVPRDRNGTFEPQIYTAATEVEAEQRLAEPNDEAVSKLLYLALRNIAKKWTMPVHAWKDALNRLAIIYEGTVAGDLGIVMIDTTNQQRERPGLWKPWKNKLPFFIVPTAPTASDKSAKRKQRTKPPTIVYTKCLTTEIQLAVRSPKTVTTVVVRVLE